MKKIKIMKASEVCDYINSLDRKAIYELLYSELMYNNFISFNKKNIKNKRFNLKSYEEAYDKASRISNISCIKKTNYTFLYYINQFTRYIDMSTLEPEGSLLKPEYEVIEKSNNRYKVIITCAINKNFKEKLHMYAPNEVTAINRAELAIRHKIVPHKIKD